MEASYMNNVDEINFFAHVIESSCMIHFISCHASMKFIYHRRIPFNFAVSTAMILDERDSHIQIEIYKKRT